jgi:RNA-directed DNA polymerase
MMVDLRDRLAKFGLALHEDKTRLIEFGRLPFGLHRLDAEPGASDQKARYRTGRRPCPAQRRGRHLRCYRNPGRRGLRKRRLLNPRERVCDGMRYSAPYRGS